MQARAGRGAGEDSGAGGTPYGELTRVRVPTTPRLSQKASWNRGPGSVFPARRLVGAGSPGVTAAGAGTRATNQGAVSPRRPEVEAGAAQCARSAVPPTGRPGTGRLPATGPGLRTSAWETRAPLLFAEADPMLVLRNLKSA